MSQAETLRRELAQILNKEAEAQSDLAKYTREANKYASEGAKKSEAALKSKSVSSRSSYLRQAESSMNKSAAAEKKVADARKKLATLAAQKANKQKSLSTAEKSNRDKLSRETAKMRREELNHVRQVTSMRRMAIAIQAPKPEPLRVLYLTTNSDAFGPGALRTDVEIRNVQNELKGTLYRNRVQISHLPAATYDDMLRGLNDVRPHVVHFSGHGGAGGIFFDNGSVENPAGVVMNFDRLGKFLSATDEPPRLLVLNACDTLDGVETLLDSVPVVVAMSESITDIAAAMFATKFYSAIGSAQSVESALNQGRAILSMLDSAEDHLPECVYREDVDISALILVTPD